MLYYLSLGSNLGEREQLLSLAIAQLEQKAGQVVRRSEWYYSEPWGYKSANGFCNVCVALESDLQPMEMLRTTQLIERALGRTHKTRKDAKHRPTAGYADRTIDIDLLECYAEGEAIRIDSPELTLPHPLMEERDFVMIPLREIKQAH